MELFGDVAFLARLQFTLIVAFHFVFVPLSIGIGLITAIAGIAGGRPGVVGTGILGATRTSMYTSFDEVKELEILPKEHLIRLNETLSRNQVYAEDEDFAFVAGYIKARCRNAKVKI